ncbi:MAG: EamA family transporter [Paludibacteraceae bacterium]|nr:EamA family transporter [Paludibacteraceae bacterium]
MPLFLLALCQSLLLCSAQVLLKIALTRMGTFAWTGAFWWSLLTNWWLLASGVLFAGAAVLWMYILRHFPFSHAYPLVSMAYVFGIIAAVLVFHETIAWTQWVGVLLIMGGCYLVTQ